MQSTNPELAAEFHPTKNGELTPSDFTPGSDKKEWWKCDKADDHNRMGKNIKEKIKESREEILELELTNSPLDKHFNFGLSIMKNINYYYDNADVPTKQKIVGSIFPEKFVFLKTKYRTAYLDEFIALILSNHEGFKKLKIKRPRQNGEVYMKAPPLGLEPRTL